MIKEVNSILWFKLNGLLRSLIAHVGTELTDIYIVNEYPKSGGTWLSQMLSSALEVPFPRNRLPVMGPSLLHGHFRSNWNIRNMVLMWRDGRDVLVSQYYHAIHLHGGRDGPKGRISKILNFGDINDVENNLPKFIEYMFTSSDVRGYTWPKFVDYWHNTPGAVETSYELLRKDTVSEVTRIVMELSGQKLPSDSVVDIVNKFSFIEQSRRQAGQEVKNNF